MTYLEDGKVVPVDKSELPVELPEDIDLNSQGTFRLIQIGNTQPKNLPVKKG